jgi:ABC-type transport system involved in cytochrome bd biosynthesis fused ATPase/permease subunit
MQRLIEKLDRARPREPKSEVVIRDVNRRLGSKTIARLVADYRAGIPTTDLTTKYGIGKSTVLRLLQDNNAPMRRQGVSENQAIQAIALYAEGKSLTMIADELKLAKQSIRLALLKAGVTMRPGGGQPGGTAKLLQSREGDF